jgi:hypothetical protein
VSTSEPYIEFRGSVRCRRDDASPLGLTLVGRVVDAPEEIAHLAFVGVAPEDLPDELHDARVYRNSDREYRVVSGQGDWALSASAVHLHRDVRGPFFKAIPPHVPPLWKRLFWRLVLAVAANPMGKRFLGRRSR